MDLEQVDRSEMVRVVNDNPFVIKGRFAGKDYAFSPNSPVDIHPEVAKHIFGYDGDEKDKQRAFNRLGWAITSDDIENADRKMQLVRFEEPPELVEVPRTQKPKKLTGDARAPVNTSGDEPEGADPLSGETLPDEDVVTI